VSLVSQVTALAAAIAAECKALRAAHPTVMALAGNYMTHPFVTTVAAGAVTAGQTTYIPIFIPVTRTFDRIGVNVTTAAVAGTAPVLRLGIYRDDGSHSRPGVLVLDAGAVTITATGVQAVTINQQLTPGLYWLAAQYTHTVAPSTLLQVNCFSAGATGFAGFGGYRFHSATGQAAGALPGTAPTVTQQTGATGILVGIRPT
jgi:hypothetical protein